MLSIFLVSKITKKSIYVDIARLQWTRKQRIANGERINERRALVGFDEKKGGEEDGLEVNEAVSRERIVMRRISRGSIMVLAVWVLGAWAAYFWGVATGNND